MADSQRYMEIQKELNSWHCHIDHAMKKLFETFLSDPKVILTEDDMKCWLFRYLQEERCKMYKPYAIHSEVTHHMNNIVKKEGGGAT